MKTKYKYIEMIKQPENKKKKTDTYFIMSNSSGWEIGVIRWYSSWRQYCFFPNINTLYSKGCLDDISHFINQLMEERKNHGS